jgi:uncharacterized protein
MEILVTGATGLIGKPLVKQLISSGHSVSVLSRDKARAKQEILNITAAYDWDEVARAVGENEATIHLAGVSVAAERWTQEFKMSILTSRVETTTKIAQAKPNILICASATGWYGEGGDTIMTEGRPSSQDFFGEVCKRWEAAAEITQNAGGRVAHLRIGQVLAREGGALASMLKPPQVPIPVWQLGLGGPLGSGKQWVSWIHRADVIGLFCFCLENESVSGPINTISPNPVTAKEFADILGKVLGKPSMLPIPAFALRILVGELANYLLASQRILPKRALEYGYVFQYPDLEKALSDLLKVAR